MLQTGRFIVSLALLSVIACQPSGTSALSEADVAAIEATSQTWLEAARASDWAAVAATYTADAVLMPPNEPAVEGRSNIQAWFEAYPPTSEIDVGSVEIEGRGDLAFVRGTFLVTITPEGMDPITDSGKYFEIRRRQADGSWLISRDMFSSDLPVPE